MADESRELGPVDIVVIGYAKDAPLTGEAAEVVLDLVGRGIIRVLDVLFVVKEEDGTFAGIAASDIEADRVGSLAVFDGASSGLLGDEDAAVAAEAMEPGQAAAVIMFENRWAAPFVAAVRRNGGHLIDFERIPADELLEAIERSEAVGA